MSLLRRAAQVLAIAALGVLAFALILEPAGSGWLDGMAGIIEDAAFPDWDPWVTVAAGLAAAVVGVTLLAAQLAPPKKGLRTVHDVYSGPDGSTRIRGRAAIAAARHEVESVEGVVAVDASIDTKTKTKSMTVVVRVDDQASLAAVETHVRERLGHDFWINLGLADFAVNLLITHHPRPPRVR